MIYLRISWIIFVEKKLSYGEISAFHVWHLWGNWKFLHMWRNFRCLYMTDVEKSEILHLWHVCDVENVAISAKILYFFKRLPQFTRFLNSNFKNWAQKYICGETLTNMRSVRRRIMILNVDPYQTLSSS